MENQQPSASGALKAQFIKRAPRSEEEREKLIAEAGEIAAEK